MTALRERLNAAWHERTLQLFTGIVLLHWAEHLTPMIDHLVPDAHERAAMRCSCALRPRTAVA